MTFRSEYNNIYRCTPSKQQWISAFSLSFLPDIVRASLVITTIDYWLIFSAFAMEKRTLLQPVDFYSTSKSWWARKSCYTSSLMIMIMMMICIFIITIIIIWKFPTSQQAKKCLLKYTYGLLRNFILFPRYVLDTTIWPIKWKIPL